MITSCESVSMSSFLRSEIPKCIDKEFEIVQKYFTEVESSISNLIEDLAGSSNTQWISDEKESRSFSEKYYKVISY